MQARMGLPPEPTSPRLARHFVTTTLVEAGRSDLVDVATLLVTELVTNAVLHARTELEVEIDDAKAGLRFAVYDRSPAMPRLRHNSLAAATGRGLRLVDTLAGGWHADPTPEGKRVYFDLSAEGADVEPDLDAWDDDPGRVAL
jgi:anti-sigma regulatory factor (Ser/Thr protein kinase)